MFFRSTTRKAHHKSDFWKFWTGQTISTIGSAVTGFVLPLFIFKLTGSALNLALTITITVLPYLLFGLVIGAWADRVNRKRLMIAADIARALIIATIPLAYWQGFLSVWWIYVVAFLNSSFTICFDAANFAAIPCLVPQEDLAAANGQIQAGYSIANVLGPLLGGLLILVLPLPSLIFIDAISFLLSAISLIMIQTSFHLEKNEQPEVVSLRHDIAEGLRYVLHHPIISWIIILLFLVNFLLPISSAQIVLFAKQWFTANDTQIGLLYAGESLGTIIFSLAAQRLGTRWSAGTIALWGLMLVGVFTALTAATHLYWLLVLLWALRGGSDVLFTINTYTLAQTEVPNQMLSRVIIVTRVLTWSTASIGVLLGGYIIEKTQQVAAVYAITGLLIFAITLTFFFTPPGSRYRNYFSSKGEGEKPEASELMTKGHEIEP